MTSRTRAVVLFPTATLPTTATTGTGSGRVAEKPCAQPLRERHVHVRDLGRADAAVDHQLIMPQAPGR